MLKFFQSPPIFQYFEDSIPPIFKWAGGAGFPTGVEDMEGGFALQLGGTPQNLMGDLGKYMGKACGGLKCC